MLWPFLLPTFLILLGAGTYSTFESVYAQVNVMPGSNEPANTTPSGGGSGTVPAPVFALMPPT